MTGPRKERLAAAVAALLEASGLDRHAPDFAETPERVADLWEREFLSGYRMDPRAILAGGMAASPGEGDAVTVTGIAFHALCPHHLLPFRGQAHLAYVPDGRIVGFGRLAALVACFTQRLTLQERATAEIAEALVDLLPARGAGCVLVAEQTCLALPGDRHSDSRVVTSAFRGIMAERPDLQARLTTLAGAG